MLRCENFRYLLSVMEEYNLSTNVKILIRNSKNIIIAIQLIDYEYELVLFRILIQNNQYVHAYLI